MITRKDIETLEEKDLSPLAMKSKNSRGRKYPEQKHPYRTTYQRDRDRIIHSAAFRRLEYKTQVFVYHEGDYYRTRLTHTLEVSQIGRTIAKALSLNETLTEALCLAHDLGHTPFGHAGEEILNNLMEKHGGFDHNLQGLRVVDILETRYPQFSGLNLSWETREGIIKHTTKYDNADKFLKNLPDLLPNENPTMEAQAMDIADEIAYNNHDLDDGIKSDMLSLDSLEKNQLWKRISSKLKNEYTALKNNIFIPLVIRNIIDEQVSDLINNTEKNIKKTKVNNWQEIKHLPVRIVNFSKKMQDERDQLRDFLYKNLYLHWRVSKMSDKAKRFLRKLFETYHNNTYIISPEFQKRIEYDGLERTICDYISGMTDRCALEEYKRLFDPYEKI